MTLSIHCLLNYKKSAQKVVWSKDLVYKGTFRLSSRTPHAYKVSYELLRIVFSSLLIKQSVKQNQRK